jgi:hypothetical protein
LRTCTSCCYRWQRTLIPCSDESFIAGIDECEPCSLMPGRDYRCPKDAGNDLDPDFVRDGSRARRRRWRNARQDYSAATFSRARCTSEQYRVTMKAIRPQTYSSGVPP